MIRSLTLGKTLCISNKHYKYYMASLNISFQGNDTDFHSTIKMGMGGRSGQWRVKRNCTGEIKNPRFQICPDLAWAWASYKEHLHNWDVLNIKREGRDIYKLASSTSQFTETESKAQPILGSLWAISPLPRICNLACSLLCNLATKHCPCTSACNALNG